MPEITHRLGRGLLAITALTLMMGGCADAEEVMPEANNQGAPTEVTYSPELAVDLDAMEQTPSGLYYQTLREGTGDPAAPGDEVVVHYTGWLPDGSEFDSSRTGGQPFVFGLGGGEVISGWDEGVSGMTVGEQRRLVIPPDLAYGAEGAGDVIPPNATLVFDVELLEVR
ncbi:MAG TPA: FKBP-type peptidyl-prolyl cis-trans isomerase [Longimicrobiaceae bacterium]|nr:FKBP-type peptidyl-prolyl cis-trans isomerase [Longimicrobiaceae bacterium]